MRPSYWWMQKKKAVRRYRTLVRRNEEAVRQSSALVNWQMDLSSGKRWRTEEKVSILLEPELSSSVPVPSSYPRTFRKYKSILHCKTMYCYLKVSPSIFITSETGKNCGLILGGVSLKTGRQAVFFTVVNPMDNQDGWGETLCDLSQARIAADKNTWKHFQDTAIWSSLNKEDCNFTKQDQTQLFTTTHCLQSSLRKRYAWRPRISFSKGKAWFEDRVLFFKLIRKVAHKIYLYKKQDHLGNRNKMRRATGNPKQHCWLSNTWYIDLNGETAGCTTTK